MILTCFSKGPKKNQTKLMYRKKSRSQDTKANNLNVLESSAWVAAKSLCWGLEKTESQLLKRDTSFMHLSLLSPYEGMSH